MNENGIWSKRSKTGREDHQVKIIIGFVLTLLMMPNVSKLDLSPTSLISGGSPPSHSVCDSRDLAKPI